MLFCFIKIILLMILVNLKRFCQKGSDLVFTSFFKRYKKLFVFLSTCLILVSYFCLDCFATVGFTDSLDNPDLVTPFNCVVSYDIYSETVLNNISDPDFDFDDYFLSKVYFNLPNLFFSSDFNFYPDSNSSSTLDFSDDQWYASLYFSEFVGYNNSSFDISPFYEFRSSLVLSSYPAYIIPKRITLDFNNCLMSNSSGDFLLNSNSIHNGSVAHISYGTYGYFTGYFLFGASKCWTSYPVHSIDLDGSTLEGYIDLNYYYVLINSDIPWEDYEDVISEHLDYDDFIDGVTELRDSFSSTVDRSSPSYLENCYNLFSWCPSILGDFSFDPLNDPLDYNDSLELSDNVSFLSRLDVIEKDDYSSYNQYLIEDAIWNGKSGFERVSWFLGTAVSGFLSLEIMPNFSFAGLLIVIVSFSIVMWWLKVFAGG